MLWFTKKKEKKKKNSDKLNLNIVTQNFHKGVYVYEEKTKQIAEWDDTTKHFMKVMRWRLSWKQVELRIDCFLLSLQIIID